MTTTAVHTYSHSIGLNNILNRGFFQPVDMALGSDSILFVANRGAVETPRYIPWKRITVCTLDGEYMGDISSGGREDGQIMWPVALAVDGDDNVYVSDEALHRISVFTRQGQFLGKWGEKGRGDGEFDRPAGMAFDREGNLLVVDALNSRVQRYTKDGRYLGGWGRPGSGDGEFNVPWGISVDDAGNVYVADWRNDRIQKFDADGAHLATWGTSGSGEGEFRRPAGIAVGRDGSIYIADWGNDSVQVLAPDGGFRARLRGECVTTAWAEEWFASGHQDMLDVRKTADLEPQPDPWQGDFFGDEPANIEKLFWAPTSVKVDAQGRVYVVDTCRHRIQIFNTES